MQNQNSIFWNLQLHENIRKPIFRNLEEANGRKKFRKKIEKRLVKIEDGLNYFERWVKMANRQHRKNWWWALKNHPAIPPHQLTIFLKSATRSQKWGNYPTPIFWKNDHPFFQKITCSHPGQPVYMHPIFIKIFRRFGQKWVTQFSRIAPNFSPHFAESQSFLNIENRRFAPKSNVAFFEFHARLTAEIFVVIFKNHSKPVSQISRFGVLTIKNHELTDRIFAWQLIDFYRWPAIKN